ncbi:MAG: hypothetical protein Kow00114_03030 [Kiloniellaceae bacterium]
MIPTTQEIVYRVFGALYLARFQAQGTAYFDESPAATLRSFFAAAIVAPAFGIALLLGEHEPPVADSVIVALAVALSYCLGWTVFPVIAHRICQVIGNETAFFRYISAKNWVGVVTTHLALVVAVLSASGVLPEALLPLLELVLFGYVVVLQWFIARQCLQVSVTGAIGLVALDTIIDVFIVNIAHGIIY